MVFTCVCGYFLFSPLPTEPSCCWLCMAHLAPAKSLLKPKRFLQIRVHIKLVSAG